MGNKRAVLNEAGMNFPSNFGVYREIIALLCRIGFVLTLPKIP